MVEYAALIGGVAIVLMISFQFVGQATVSLLGVVGEEFMDNQIVVADDGTSISSQCPTGWDLVPNNETKKKGQNVDANNDGMICRKQILGLGEGNTGNNANVKDNNN